MLERCAGKASAHETPIGYLPGVADLNLQGLDVSAAAMSELLAVDKVQWRAEAREIRSYVNEFGERVPAGLHTEIDALEQRLG